MEYSIGMFARAKAGHDKGKLYIISKVEDEYVYLVDGKIRTIDNPKKKRKKHIQIDYQIAGQALRNEDIKRAIKLKNDKNCKN